MVHSQRLLTLKAQASERSLAENYVIGNYLALDHVCLQDQRLTAYGAAPLGVR